MRVDIITVFPDYLAPLQLSLVGKAQREGLLQVEVHDLRGWTSDRHRTVDDSPYGGGPGMVMRPDVFGRAIDDFRQAGNTAPPDAVGTMSQTPAPPTLLVPTPSGTPLTQAVAADLVRQTSHLIIACGRYEGIDSRVVTHFAAHMPVLEFSIGDVVVAGGEVAALVVVEAVARLLPGVLGNEASAADDSFAAGRNGAPLEGPVYTRPPLWQGLSVPEVLRSGDHAAIARWRAEQSLARTWAMRPELLDERTDPA